MAPKLFGPRSIRIRSFATGVLASLAEKAFAAGNCERNDDAIAHLKLLVVRPQFDNIAHRLMA
jgi:hypothetical protein